MLVIVGCGSGNQSQSNAKKVKQKRDGNDAISLTTFFLILVRKVQ